MISVNLNDIVRVKFTEHGKDIYYHQWDDMNKWAEERGLAASKYLTPEYPKVDENGFTEIQLWHFMEIYGSHLYNGCKAVIEDNCLYLDETGDDFKKYRLEYVSR